MADDLRFVHFSDTHIVRPGVQLRDVDTCRTLERVVVGAQMEEKVLWKANEVPPHRLDKDFSPPAQRRRAVQRASAGPPIHSRRSSATRTRARSSGRLRPRRPLVTGLALGRKPINRWPAAAGAMSWRSASKTTLNWASYFCSSASSFRASASFEVSRPRSRTKVRMISMLTRTARRLWRTLDNMATPSCVNAYGRYFRCSPRPGFKVANCDLKTLASVAVSLNMKSPGKRRAFRLTC